MRRANNRGFTLLEVLVALAILAIAMAAAVRAVGSSTEHVDDLRLRLMADWVAQNRLALHAARNDWLPVGEQRGEETQGGVDFSWREKITPTPNPAFRRIEVSVGRKDHPEETLRTLTGYLVEQPRYR